MKMQVEYLGSTMLLIRSLSQHVKGMMLTRSIKDQNIRVVGKFPRLRGRKQILIEMGVTFNNLTARSRISASTQGHIHICENVFINQGCNIHSEIEITICENVKIGENVTIFDSSFHPKFLGDEVKREKVYIGQGTWIANNVVILPGVELGAGTVVGIGSIVTKSFPPNSFLVGNPAVQKGKFTKTVE